MTDNARIIDFLVAGLEDENGNPLSGGKVYAYAAGTTTFKNTWTLRDKSIISSNPLILDTYGRVIAYGDGVYKFNLYDANDNFIKTIPDYEVFFQPYWVDVRSYASINAAVAAIGATETVLFVPNAQTLTANLTIPTTLKLVISKGGSIIKASTYTLTINGPFEAGPYQVFSGFATGVTFGAGSANEIYPDWWATNTTPGTTDMSDALVAAFQSTNNTGIPVKFMGNYAISKQQLALDLFLADGTSPINNLTIFADSPNIGKITSKHASPQSGIRYNGTAAPINNLTIRNVGFIGNSQYTLNTWTYGNAVTLRYFTNAIIEGCYFENWPLSAAYAGTYATSPSSNFTFRNNVVVCTGGLVAGTGVSYGNIQGKVDLTGNRFDYISRPMTLETSSALTIGNVTIDNNLIAHGALSTVSATNTYAGIHFLLDFTGNTIESVQITNNKFSQNPGADVGSAEMFIEGVTGENVFKSIIISKNISYLPAPNAIYYLKYLTSGLVDGNMIIANNVTGVGITNYGCTDVLFSNNVFKGTFSYDIVEDGASTPTNNIYANNLLSESGGGYSFVSTSSAKVVGPYGTSNQMVIGSPMRTFVDKDATPSVARGNVFKTANTGATTITNFDDGVDGQRIAIRFTDSDTTIDFSGTNLWGNGGVDWNPDAGDYMDCVNIGGTYWYCAVHDCTT